MTVAIPPPHLCCWPDGDIPNIAWCNKPAIPDKPYCKSHCERAYVKDAATKIDEGRKRR